MSSRDHSLVILKELSRERSREELIEFYNKWSKTYDEVTL